MKHTDLGDGDLKNSKVNLSCFYDWINISINTYILSKLWMKITDISTHDNNIWQVNKSYIAERSEYI